MTKAWETGVARWFCGPVHPEGEWVAADAAGHMHFIARHGVLFEDNKGEHPEICGQRTVLFTQALFTQALFTQSCQTL